MSITIRAATANDFEAVMVLIKQLAAFQGTPEKVTNTTTLMQEEQPFFNILVAETATKQIAGIAVYFFAYYTWVGKSLYLDDLYVAEPYRGQKAGTQLLKELFTIAQNNNCKRVRWMVSDWNKPAIAFYTRLGAGIDTHAFVCDVEGHHIGQLAQSL